MNMVIGPILKRAGAYVFDTWNAPEGLHQGYPYRRIEDASYARNAAIQLGRMSEALEASVCQTLDEFMALTGGYGLIAAA